MIFVRYQDFRPGFAEAGAPLVADGFPEWPYAKLRSGGFSNSFAFSSGANQFPMDVTCNAFAADATLSDDDFDWYVSQRTDLTGNQYFTVDPFAANKSGSITIDVVDATVKALIPSLVGLNASDLRAALANQAHLKLLFRDVAFYVSRRSDKAYQWISIWNSV